MAALLPENCQFNSLSTKIAKLLLTRTKDNRGLILKTLDELNSINYKYYKVTSPTKAVLLINQLCQLIPPEDTDLVARCCKLFISLFSQQNIVVEGRTLDILVMWCQGAVNGDDADLEVLLTFNALMRMSASCELAASIAKFPPLLNQSRNTKNLNVALAALQCFETSTFITSNCKKTQSHNCRDFYCDLYKNLMNDFLKIDGSRNNLLKIKMVAVYLLIICNILTKETNLASENLDIVLGIIKTYMVFGNNKNALEFKKPERLIPSQLSIPEPSRVQDKKGGKVAKQRKPAITKKSDQHQQKGWNDFEPSIEYSPANTADTNVELNSASGMGNSRVKTSDSDFSDSEEGNAAKNAARVREAALNLFQQVAKTVDKKMMFSYWSSFIPQDDLSSSHPNNLTVCILQDSSAKVRTAALNVLLVLLTSSRQYLVHAEKGEPLSFTPFSFTVFLMINSLHNSLLLALGKFPVLILPQVLKCLAALVQATPYHKLDPEMLRKVIGSVRPFLHHRDPTVQVNALIVIGCALSTKPVLYETQKLFVDSSGNDNDSDSPSQISWVLECCLTNLGVRKNGSEILKNNTPFAVKLESLQVVSAMTRHYFDLLMEPHIPLITEALDLSLRDKFQDVKLFAGRALELVGLALSQHFSEQEQGQLLDERNAEENAVECFWNKLLEGGLKNLLLAEDQPANLKVVACNCIASIGTYAYERLSKNHQLMCVFHLFNLCRTDVQVKGAAIRALAILAEHPSLRNDPGYVSDALMAAIDVLSDKNTIVRAKAAWALSNLSDALISIQSNSDLYERIPSDLLLKTLQTASKASKDVDRVKMHGIRALGNILQVVTEDLMEKDEFKHGVTVAFHHLISVCSTAMNVKVKWNGCYALGQVMKNYAIFCPDYSKSQLPAHLAFNVLTNLMETSQNLKVRIAAAVALSRPTERKSYGSHYRELWCSLAKALLDSSLGNMEDFNEYKHRDQLFEQICLTFAHLVTLLQKTDIVTIEKCLAEHSDTIKMHINLVWVRLLPEKSTVLVEAKSHVSDLRRQDDSLSGKQREILQRLYEVLDPELF